MTKLVRASVEADMEDVQRIYAHEVLNGRTSFEQTPPSVHEMSRRRQSVLDLGLPHLAAELDNEIVRFSQIPQKLVGNKFRGG